jgi:beta-lactamase superfamily II metal-dependent hydrolase
MLTITVKNVGHGDTIILEWQDDNKNTEIGIIDCNLKNGKSNPAIDHIRDKKYEKIHFMILTHPHTDHFSGFLSLLEFCEKNKIEIEKFWHTAIYNIAFLEESIYQKMTPRHLLESYVNRKCDINKIKRLFRKIDVLRKGTKPIIKEVNFINGTSMLDLNNKLRLKCLSPSSIEFENYFKYTFKLNSEGELDIVKNRRRENNPMANVLSPFIKVFSNDWHILLTSDSMSSTIERLNNNFKNLINNRLIISQVPHHGSIHSHYETFWLRVPGRKDVPVFISSGRKYGLPFREVVQFFKKNYKEVFFTNSVGVLKENFEDRKDSNNNGRKSYYRDHAYDAYKSVFLEKELLSEEYVQPNNCREIQIKIKGDGSLTVDSKRRLENMN